MAETGYILHGVRYIERTRSGRIGIHGYCWDFADVPKPGLAFVVDTYGGIKSFRIVDMEPALRIESYGTGNLIRWDAWAEEEDAAPQDDAP